MSNQVFCYKFIHVVQSNWPHVAYVCLKLPQIFGLKKVVFVFTYALISPCGRNLILLQLAEQLSGPEALSVTSSLVTDWIDTRFL